MSAAHIVIYCQGEQMRKYGGILTDVKYMKRKYESMSREDFLKLHPHLTDADYDTLEVSNVYKH